MSTHPPVHPAAALVQSRFHAGVVAEVKAAVDRDALVVVGMAWNPFVPRARKLLEAKGQAYTYLGYGSYLSKWKERLALKLWAGWPTFPQVYVHGQLIGGYTDLAKLIESGELDTLLAAGRAA